MFKNYHVYDNFGQSSETHAIRIGIVVTNGRTQIFAGVNTKLIKNFLMV